MADFIIFLLKKDQWHWNCIAFTKKFKRTRTTVNCAYCTTVSLCKRLVAFFFWFVCLQFFVPIEIFSLIWKCHRTINGEWQQMLTYTGHSWPLSSEKSLTLHIYNEMGQPFTMVIYDHWHSHLLQSAWQWSCHYHI